MSTITFERVGPGQTASPAEQDDLAFGPTGAFGLLQFGPTSTTQTAGETRPLVFDADMSRSTTEAGYFIAGDDAPVTIAVKSNGTAVNLTTASSFSLRLKDSESGTATATAITTGDIVSATAGTVRWQPTTELDAAGVFLAEFLVTWSDATTTAYPNRGNVYVIVQEANT